MSKRKAESAIDPPLEKRIKTPSKCQACDHHNNESPSKLINKVTPSKNLTPSKESTIKPSDNKKTPTKDSKHHDENPSSLYLSNAETSHKKPSIFGNLLTVGNLPSSIEPTQNKSSLFVNLLKCPLNPSKNEQPSIFGGLLTSTNPSLNPTKNECNGQSKPVAFGPPLTSTNTEPNKIENPSIFGSLFKGGLFAQQNGNGNGQSQSLFSGSGSLFTINRFTSKDSDDESNDEGENPECKSPQINAGESFGNFKYDELYEKIIQKPFHKAKVDEKSCENGTISIEKGKTQTNSIVLIIRNQAKLIFEQGLVLKKFTKLGTINHRSDGLNAIVFKEEGGKLKRKLFKILFSNNKDCDDFKEELNKLI